MLHLRQDLDAVVLALFYVVGVVDDHLHQARQWDLLQIPQKDCLHYLEKGLFLHLAFLISFGDHLFGDFWFHFW